MSSRMLKLLSLQTEINKEIQIYLKALKQSPLSCSIAYALNSKGKRLRPMLTKLMATSIGKGVCVNQPALAIELFHTASLIADDLPCMDNDDFRRGKASLHKKFGESTALLVSYALITEGFDLIGKSGDLYYKDGSGTKEDGQKRVCLALKETTKLSGPSGAVLGQYFDIEQTNVNSEEDFEELYYLKTGTLFQGAFTLGYIFGGGDLDNLHLIEKLSRHFGFAFQLRDDLEDINDECMSFAKKFGEAETINRCKKEIEGIYLALDLLKLDILPFQEIINYLFPKEIFQASFHAL